VEYCGQVVVTMYTWDCCRLDCFLGVYAKKRLLVEKISTKSTWCKTGRSTRSAPCEEYRVPGETRACVTRRSMMALADDDVFQKRCWFLAGHGISITQLVVDETV
jgi:hypothetical protein